MFNEYKMLEQAGFVSAILDEMSFESQYSSPVFYKGTNSIKWDDIEFKVDYFYEDYVNNYSINGIQALSQIFKKLHFLCLR